MRRLALCVSLPILVALLMPLSAQERVKPKAAKGGKEFGQAWAQVPEEYKKLRIPDWTVPTELAQWQKDRVKVRATLVKCMGDLPARPDPRKVAPTFKSEGNDYTTQWFE